MQPRVDPLVAQIQKQIDLLQAQLAVLSKTKNEGGGLKQNSGTKEGINPKT